MPDNILLSFGLDPAKYRVEAFGSGLINSTWKISGKDDAYVLQRINKNVFKRPEDIAGNLLKLANYLKETNKNYLFTAPLKAANGKYMVEEGNEFYRLTPYIQDSYTIDFSTNSAQAYEAAKQFGRFTKLLNGFDTSQLKYTLPDFHNLSLRTAQFKTALIMAPAGRKQQAAKEIQLIEANMDIADFYEQLVKGGQMPLRVIHHDTKINNVLFDENGKGLCVIDLDTVMPGYYISDVGDMMRTYLSEANEEEQDLARIKIRTDFFLAIYRGYMEEMGAILSPFEKELFIYAGKFMIYMQAIRFLTDFLNGDVYYQTHYPGQNLLRAKNQLALLLNYIGSEEQLHDLISEFGNTTLHAN
jgi:Ser/Thr protein kinase RdoA (MazF antagonist)